MLYIGFNTYLVENVMNLYHTYYIDYVLIYMYANSRVKELFNFAKYSSAAM